MFKEDRKKGFTLIELLVVMAIIMLLASLLVPALKNARQRALSAFCLSNLHQWSVVFSLYHEENDGVFEPADLVGLERYWPHTVRSYYDQEKFLLCPVALRPKPVPSPEIPGASHRGSTYHTWSPANSTYAPSAWGALIDYSGSYGKNGWVANPAGNRWYFDANMDENAWHREQMAEKPSLVPLLLDSAWVHTLPLSSDPPPPQFDYVDPTGFGQNMKLHCMDRHLGAINGLFLDGHATRIELKEIWTLKWHPLFNTENQWTKAGGVRPSSWPKWMRMFEAY